MYEYDFDAMTISELKDILVKEPNQIMTVGEWLAKNKWIWNISAYGINVCDDEVEIGDGVDVEWMMGGLPTD